MFFHSNALEVGVLAQAAKYPEVFNALMVLLDGHCHDLVMVPVQRYMSEEELGGNQPTFWGLWDRVRQQRQLLVGWKQASAPKAAMNPVRGKRDQPVPLESGDHLIVISKIPDST